MKSVGIALQSAISNQLWHLKDLYIPLDWFEHFPEINICCNSKANRRLWAESP